MSKYIIFFGEIQVAIKKGVADHESQTMNKAQALLNAISQAESSDSFTLGGGHAATG